MPKIIANLISDIKTGDVVRRFDHNAKKDKWLMVVGTTADSVAFVRINSRINERCYSAEEMPYLLQILKRDVYFLHHDSVVDCTELLEYRKDIVIRDLRTDANAMRGEMPSEKLEQIRNLIVSCNKIKQRQKEKYGLTQ